MNTELISLSGELEKIIYCSDDTGFTVAVLRMDQKTGMHNMFDENMTIVGKMPGLTPGVDLEVQGSWAVNKRFGRQFQVEQFKIIIPTSKEGTIKYLGSGMLKGIGPATAKKIVDKFGDGTFEMLDNDIDRLLEIKGFSSKKLAEVKRLWNEQKEFKDLIVFLQQCGLGISYMGRIYREFGMDAIDIISKNPYRLAEQITGIGFKKADAAALHLGLSPDSPMRIESGIIFTLQELASKEGHVLLPYNELIKEAANILLVPEELVRKSLAALIVGKKVIVDELFDTDDSAAESNAGKGVYLTKMYYAETGIAQKLDELVSKRQKSIEHSMLDIDAGTDENVAVEEMIKKIEQKIMVELSSRQRDAVISSLKGKVSIITGGPGTGKTTLVNILIRAAAKYGRKVLLAAPTGRAAKRLAESTGQPAKTIHRLLEFSVREGRFIKDDKNSLSADMIILDEVSMIDTQLFYCFLKAVPLQAQLVMVGDANQLPSVGPGNILSDLINSKAIKVVELQEIFRQAGESMIISNSHRINSGGYPEVKQPVGDELLDFYIVEKDDQEDVLEMIKELYKVRIVERFKMNIMEDIQILSPVNKGPLGTTNLNIVMQELVNAGDGGLTKGGRVYKKGDKVMQIKNNYDKEVFNGDIGVVAKVDLIDKKVIVDFEQRMIMYTFGELDELVLAYAISVHKSQGSEYSAVIIPVVMSHYIMLQRNLLYTAITRARKLVVLVGSPKALKIAIKNDKIKTRYSGLEKRLRG